jgi:putative alpha-1,2-mannosidase
VILLWIACHREPPADPDTTAAPIDAYDPLEWVDPFIGTGGTAFDIGSVNPGALRPFGRVKVGPDTIGPLGDIDFAHCAGYHYGDTHIVGFTHTHAYGMGVPDYGAVLFMPRDGVAEAWFADSTRAAPFSHADEEASPGTYRVTLEEDGVDVA